MPPSSSNKKVTNSLVAVSCAAILGVYTAGYARTREAANQFDERVERRAAVPARAPAEAANVVASPNQEIVAPPPADPRAARVAPQEAKAIAPVEATPAVANETIVSSPVAENAVVVPPPAPVNAPPAVTAPPPVAVAPVKAPAAPVPAPTAPTAPKWKDGTYTGWGTSRHGDIEAAVLIEGGRILSATITQCLTRYSCDVIDILPPQVAQRQSGEVDFVSRATESADAFYYAVAEALSKAK